MSGSRPAKMAAEIIRACGDMWSTGTVALLRWARADVFLSAVMEAASVAVAEPDFSCDIGLHHWQQIKIASGAPKRMLRCGTKSVVRELPQRRMVSGSRRMV